MTYFGNLLFNALQKSCKETWHSNVALFPLSPKDQTQSMAALNLLATFLILPEILEKVHTCKWQYHVGVETLQFKKSNIIIDIYWKNLIDTPTYIHVIYIEHRPCRLRVVILSCGPPVIENFIVYTRYRKMLLLMCGNLIKLFGFIKLIQCMYM